GRPSPRAQSRSRARCRPPPAGHRPRADPGLHGGRGLRRHRRLLARAARRRRPHADRRGGDRLCPGGHAPRRAPARRPLHLRPEARGDPLRPAQRSHAARAGGLHRLRGRPPACRPAGGRGRSGPDRGPRRGRGQPRSHLDAGPRQPPEPQRRGCLPAHPHRPARLCRDGGRRGGRPSHRLRPRRRHRRAARGRDHDPRCLQPAPRLGTRAARGGAPGARARAGRARDGRATGDSGGPRSSRVGGDLRLSRTVRPRPRGPRRRLPSPPPRAQGLAARRVRRRPHHAPGRSRAQPRAARDRGAARRALARL
ncbi:MAG: Cobalt-zinc-cadmium resistance protein CzcD, partial [uncultured Solirubrobacterales bacterium]